MPPNINYSNRPLQGRRPTRRRLFRPQSAAELYDEFGRQRGGVQAQVFFNIGGGLQLQGGGAPNQRADHGEVRELLDESIEDLKGIREGLRGQQRGEDADEQSLDQLVRRLEQAEERLRAARAKLAE